MTLHLDPVRSARGIRAKQPADHLDGTAHGRLRAWRHAVHAAMAEVGHAGPWWVDLGPAWAFRGRYGGCGQRCYPESPLDPLGWTDAAHDEWHAALDRALAVCDPLRPDEHRGCW